MGASDVGGNGAVEHTHRGGSQRSSMRAQWTCSVSNATTASSVFTSRSNRAYWNPSSGTCDSGGKMLRDGSDAFAPADESGRSTEGEPDGARPSISLRRARSSDEGPLLDDFGMRVVARAAKHAELNFLVQDFRANL